MISYIINSINSVRFIIKIIINYIWSGFKKDILNATTIFVLATTTCQPPHATHFFSEMINKIVYIFFNIIFIFIYLYIFRTFLNKNVFFNNVFSKKLKSYSYNFIIILLKLNILSTELKYILEILKKYIRIKETKIFVKWMIDCSGISKNCSNISNIV